jgi:hypothetical protein
MILVRLDLGRVERRRMDSQRVAMFLDSGSAAGKFHPQRLDPFAFLQPQATQVRELHRVSRQRSEDNGRHDAVTEIVSA